MGSIICKVSAYQLGDKTVGRIVGLKTLGDEEIVDEALRKAYVSGQANIILGNFCGVMKSMADSSRRDGNGRKIDSVCSIQPWLKELAMGEGDTVSWEIPEEGHHGTVSPTKVTSDATRITIAADALAEIASEEYDGKTVVFTVRGNFASAKISATLRYVAPPAPTVTGVKIGGEAFEDGLTFYAGNAGTVITGTNFTCVEGDRGVVTQVRGGSPLRSGSTC